MMYASVGGLKSNKCNDYHSAVQKLAQAPPTSNSPYSKIIKPPSNIMQTSLKIRALKKDFMERNKPLMA